MLQLRGPFPQTPIGALPITPLGDFRPQTSFPPNLQQLAMPLDSIRTVVRWQLVYSGMEWNKKIMILIMPRNVCTMTVRQRYGLSWLHRNVLMTLRPINIINWMFYNIILSQKLTKRYVFHFSKFRPTICRPRPCHWCTDGSSGLCTLAHSSEQQCIKTSALQSCSDVYQSC